METEQKQILNVRQSLFHVRRVMDRVFTWFRSQIYRLRITEVRENIFIIIIFSEVYSSLIQSTIRSLSSNFGGSFLVVELLAAEDSEQIFSETDFLVEITSFPKNGNLYHVDGARLCYPEIILADFLNRFCCVA